MTPQLSPAKEQSMSEPSVSMYGHSLTVQRPDDEHKTEVLRFLEEEPLHSVVMNGFIRDNGFDHRLNRGTFYACRNSAGTLEGVALIGHAIFLYSRNEAALSLFAQLAQQHKRTHMIMGKEETVQTFLRYYAEGGQMIRSDSRELLLALASPVPTTAPVPNLRRANPEDLPLLIPVHAALAYEESRVNPLAVDPDGFRRRCLRRVERDRVWIWIEAGQLIFKADVVSDTPEVTYVEGVYVHPNERRKSYGSRCLSQMSNSLLGWTGAVSVLVNEARDDARSFFQSVGFAARGVHETIFLQPSE